LCRSRTPEADRAPGARSTEIAGPVLLDRRLVDPGTGSVFPNSEWTATQSQLEDPRMPVHYKKDGIATFDVPTAKVFRYMSVGNHRHAAFKRHSLVGVADNVVTIDADVYNPDGSTFTTTIKHKLNPPNGIETTMIGGAFDGARFVHSYTPTGGKTKVDLEGDFPAFPGMSEADELKMIDGFFTMVFAEDTETLRTWS
jgi:hypothetical protein